MELQRDTQKQLHVESVVVGHKRTSCGSTRGVQRRAFDLDELMFGKGRTDRMNDLRSLEEAIE